MVASAGASSDRRRKLERGFPLNASASSLLGDVKIFIEKVRNGEGNMTGLPEIKIIAVHESIPAQPPPTEVERQQRASAPTLRDLRKAAVELAHAGALTDQPARNLTDAYLRNGKSANSA